jgi:hypothetical protein
LNGRAADAGRYTALGLLGVLLMKRIAITIVAISSFACGVVTSRVLNSPRKFPALVAKQEFTIRDLNPVRVRIPPIMEASNDRVAYDHYYAIVENMSTKPVRCYVLGFGTEISNVAARGFMSGNGVGYTYPDWESSDLIPGETRMIPIKATAVFSEEAFAWVDFVEFTDGSTWGANKSGTKKSTTKACVP